MSQSIELRKERREKIVALESAILAECPPLELVEKHYFAHGTYTRELHIPAGTTLTGKIHRHSCINVVAKGRIKVITDEGESEIVGYHAFVSGPNVKKAGFVLEDTIWLNVHPWDGVQTVEQIEQEAIISAEESAKLLESETLWLG